jgi:hypothetical protein
MALQSRLFALIFRLASIALIATGLVRLMGLFGGGTAAWAAFTFYTTQSTVLCLVWMAALAVRTARDMARGGPRGNALTWPRAGAAGMMAITVTMLIYLVVLAPSAFVQEGEGYRPFTLTDDLIHIITPCLVIADWFMFAPKGRLRWFEPLYWIIPPWTYLLWAFTWPLLGGNFGEGRRYPYPFADPTQANAAGVPQGWDGVAVQILILTVALDAFGFLYVVADKLLARAARKRAERSG